MPDNMYTYRKNCPPPKEKKKMNPFKMAAIGYGSALALIVVAIFAALCYWGGMKFLIAFGLAAVMFVGVLGTMYLIGSFADNYALYKSYKKHNDS